MSDTSEFEDIEVELSRQRSEAKIKEAREAIQREAEEHQKTLARENERAASELDDLLQQLSKTEQRAVRMHAYVTYMTSDWMEGSRQANVDLIALRLVTYMLTGVAK